MSKVLPFPAKAKTWETIEEMIKDPEFQRLSSEAGVAMRKIDDILADITLKFPPPDGLFWCLMGDYEVHLEISRNSED